jgi:hypothetical protein
MFLRLALLLGVLSVSGCLYEGDGGGGSSRTVADAADVEDVAAVEELVQEQQSEWNSIEWFTSRAPAARSAVQVMELSAEIRSDGRVYFSWDSYPWNDDANGHFFVWTGDRWRGGKFEGIRSGGQPVKLLSNIASGYNGHSPPAPGTRVAFAWTDKAGRERSNLATTTWR